MSNPERTRIPDELGRFILTSVPSVPYLESILLMRRERTATWDAKQMARRLYLPEAQARELLTALEGAGIAAKSTDQPGAYQYHPPPELSLILDQLAQTYISDLFAVTDLIHSSLDKRAQQFASAFRLRKDQ